VNSAPNFLYGAKHKVAFNEAHALEKEFVGALHFDALIQVVKLGQVWSFLEHLRKLSNPMREPTTVCLLD